MFRDKSPRTRTRKRMAGRIILRIVGLRLDHDSPRHAPDESTPDEITGARNGVSLKEGAREHQRPVGWSMKCHGKLKCFSSKAPSAFTPKVSVV